MVKTDDSIGEPDTNESSYNWYGVEIATPAYYFSSQAIDTVKSVCEILTDTYRINCGPKAGLHIHVGRDSRGFAFETLRSLYSTLWTFEPQIQQIHPYHRTEKNPWCMNFRTASNLAAKARISAEIPDTQYAQTGLDMLLNSQDTLALGELVGPKSGSNVMAYNIDNITRRIKRLTGHGDTSKKTIEFRQHESTLDPMQAENWARLCVGMLECWKRFCAGMLMAPRRSSGSGRCLLRLEYLIRRGFIRRKWRSRR